MTTDEYNGWVNRETWAAALYLSNDQGLDELAREAVAAGIENNRAMCARIGFTSTRVGEMGGAGIALSEMLDDMADPAGEYAGNPTIRMMLDEIGSRWRVDWAAVAESFAPEPAEALPRTLTDAEREAIYAEAQKRAAYERMYRLDAGDDRY